MKSLPIRETYFVKLQEPGVIIIDRDNVIKESFTEIVDQTSSNLSSDVTNPDSFLQQENDEVQPE